MGLSSAAAATQSVSPPDEAQPQATAVTTDDLADSGAQQQRWISSPGSRITLNPGNPAQTGPEIPLRTEFFGWGGESYQDNLKIFRTDKQAPDASATGGTVINGFREDFNDLTTNGWWTAGVTSRIVDLDSGNKGAYVETAQGSEYGSIVSKTITVDLDTYPMLRVAVPKIGEGGISKWALKIWPDGASNLTVQPDTTLTGTFDYDLSENSATSHLTGVQKFTIRLYAAGSDGVNSRDVTFDYLQFWGVQSDGSGSGSNGQFDGFSDPMDATTQSAWSTSVPNGRGSTYNVTATGGAVTNSTASATYGAAERAISIDLDQYPYFEVDVASTGGK